MTHFLPLAKDQSMARMIAAIRLLALAAIASLLPFPAHAQEEVFAITEPVQLDPAGETEFGELIYSGGVSIEPGEEEIGGISGLEWHEDRLFAVTDDGRWLTIEPDEIDGRLIDLLTVTVADLNDERGRRLRGKDEADAEAITRTPDGAWLVAFEREHRIWRYDDLAGRPSPFEIDLSGLVSPDRGNEGIEALAAHGTSLLLCGEFASGSAPNCRSGANGIAVSATIEGYEPVPTDAACRADGTCYVLLRDYTRGVGNHIAILELQPEAEPRILTALAPPLALDNFEGLAVREQFGKTWLYIVSDNNLSDNQRTLLMKFEVRQEEPVVAVAPEPVVEYETVDVVLTTTMGEIAVRLETERAPITAANFLRYVDEGRFDGTVFYRAMRLNREPQPNGLIQGGTQFDPERILPGIPHEPTTETGLSHTNGALSMAMGDPGTANGDFSIMLQDQIGLDARPDAAEPVWQNGYAVFGYVIDGMDVVSAIHAAPTDPNKGEGAMVGQMIAEPVEIVEARRVVPIE